MAIELILLAVNINLVAFSAALGDLVGPVFTMFVLTVAAGEAAIGLAILVSYFRGRGTIAVDDANRLEGLDGDPGYRFPAAARGDCRWPREIVGGACRDRGGQDGAIEVVDVSF